MKLLANNDYVKDNSLDLASENNQTTSLTDGKFSLLQFALFNFVEAIDKYVFRFFLFKRYLKLFK